MTRAVAAAAVALAVVCPAHAETRFAVDAIDDNDDAPTLAVAMPDRGKLDRVQLHVDGAHGIATMVLALSSRELVPHPLATTLDVPYGTRVTGMAVTIGGARSEATTMSASTARDRFREIVERKDDPALLELAESTRHFDRLALQVFPLAKTSPATIEITLELPPIERLAIDTSARVDLQLDGSAIQGRAVELPARDWMTSDPAPRKALSLHTSLFAAEPVRQTERITIHIGEPTSACGCVPSVGARDIRKQVRLAHPRLRHCYMQQAQRDPTLAGTAVLHFTIGSDGRTRGISVDGSLENEAVRECMAAEVATWSFMPGGVTTQVNYPLELRLAPRSDTR